MLNLPNRVLANERIILASPLPLLKLKWNTMPDADAPSSFQLTTAVDGMVENYSPIIIINNNTSNNEVPIKREPLVLPELCALYKKKRKKARAIQQQ